MTKVKIPDEVIAEFIEILEKSRDYQFAIGDKLLDLVEVIGDKNAVMRELAGELHFSPSTLYDYYRIAERWTPALRVEYQFLEWTIYRNANPDDPIDIELLDRAIDEGWTATRFKEEKFPITKDTLHIIEKIRALIKRNWKRFSPLAREELKAIMRRLEQIEMWDNPDIVIERVGEAR